MAWVPLEANPDVLNEYIKRLGVETSSAFVDVFGLDADLLAFVPQPVRAMILLFPITDAYEAFRKQEMELIQAKKQAVSDKLYFVRQTIPNACGTIGLLHALCNGLSKEAEMKPGPLKRILQNTRSMDPHQRAVELEKDRDLAAIHQECSHQGQTQAPAADEDVDLHFVCFVQCDGHLYEMDGRKPFPINHGPCSDLLHDSARVIRQFMERDPDQISFTTIALAG